MSNASRLSAASVTAVNDRTRQFGYSGGVPHLIMDAKDSGLDCNPIEGGRLLMFVPGKAGYIGPLNTLSNVRPRLYTDLMPGDYQHLVNRTFHTSEDCGYRPLTMLTALPYDVPPPIPQSPTPQRVRDNADLLREYKIRSQEYQDTYTDEWYQANDHAFLYFNVVHPTLQAACPFGLNKLTQMSDPEIGDSTPLMQVCPTCRLHHLKSDFVSKRIYDASAQMDSGLLAELRASLIEANEAAVRYVERKSEAVFSDMARKMTGTQPGRNVLNTIDRIHLKMLHRTETVDKNSDLAQSIGQAMATAIRESQAPVAAVEGKVLQGAELAEYEAWQTRRDNMAKARAAKGDKNELPDNSQEEQ